MTGGPGRPLTRPEWDQYLRLFIWPALQKAGVHPVLTTDGDVQTITVTLPPKPAEGSR